jgi:hypothetical protein
LHSFGQAACLSLLGKSTIKANNPKAERDFHHHEAGHIGATLEAEEIIWTGMV